MIYTGNSKLDVKYVAVASGADIRADWKIYEQCELPVTVVEPACSSAKACDGEAICIQGKCVECPVDHVVESGVCKRVCIKDADCDANNACDFLKDVCNKCPAGTAPREGSCDETCSTSSDCKNPLSSCLDGFCDACGDLEIVEKNACVSICDLKKDEGDCSNKVSRFFYKAATAQCLEFKSCAQADGLSNNFGSKETCKTCEPKPLPAECLLNADVGTCENYQVRYMYNKNLKKCKKFTYNGCDGNKNNFPTKDACHQYCAKYD
ncbi:hypothetical protein CAPTEDRAFT_159263 [Capitella teleta]|uniref:BPTI/Kunitz inhibitor domain-containing protein n=1 Tax=Capitella teleta TaxID=283909 RepID=R7UXM6_CAPTE|nr:hypothetical protein CAPTEDRAFT_159263 [Capitella teleta]|eukprot:ELU08677.1 hypothetical protein CAPTEDRAFT_159263 [Capitella teleta]